MAKKPVKPKRAMRWLRCMLLLVFGLAALSVMVVLLLRFVDPPTSAVRIARYGESRAHAKPLQAQSCWMTLEELGPNLPLAVIASEDQRFSSHYGFDFVELKKALKQAPGSRRGASTLSQQVAKNLFLWQGRSYFRKVLEAWFTLWIETLWSKRRILEIYLNIVEFGDGIYGGCAGARVHMGKAPIRLSPYQAALLAATLPNPHRYSAAKPTLMLSRRASWIERQMRQLGGARYLAELR